MPAAFLDDLIRRLSDESANACLEVHSRFDPVLIGHDDLARNPVDARVLAVALACRPEADFSKLKTVAAQLEHEGPLRGAADALVVAHHRRRDQTFGPYDGRLLDPQAIEKIQARFGPDHTFSPSQLESFALCPYQFYQRYVLGLKVVDERLELDEDYAGRGDDVHRVLEQIHIQARDEGVPNLIERLDVLIETRMQVDLEQHDGSASDVAAVLKEIGTRRTNKALGRYMAQFRTYAGGAGQGAKPSLFEFVFGQDDQDSGEGSTPPLLIVDGDRLLKIQGKIDRIDLIPIDGVTSFRVIDYKTGSNPSSGEVNTGLASQLPLYALAVERLVDPGGEFSLADFGYWGLRDNGFKKIKLKDDWADYRESLMKFILDLVARLRQGWFPIESRDTDCRKRCDFRAVCRVGEVRGSGKQWDDRPILEVNS